MKFWISLKFILNVCTAGDDRAKTEIVSIYNFANLQFTAFFF